MRRFRKIRNAKALCAVFLAGAISFLAQALPIRADEMTSDPEDGDNPYIYAVEIEFGSFGFYYDHGIWNEDTFSYEASSTSTDPAADTTEGRPGWYGFDGVANRIRVTNMTTMTAGSDIMTDSVQITLRYSDTPDGYYEFPLAAGSVSMYCYAEPDLATCLNAATPNIYEFIIPNVPIGQDAPTKSVYLSFSGEPRTVDGELFISGSVQRIGALTLSVSLVTQ